MRSHTLQENELHEMVILIFSNDEKNEQNAAARFRRWMFRGHLHCNTVIESGTMSKFVEFLKADRNLELRTNAAWVLTYIASGTTKQTRAVVEAGAVPAFVKFLDSWNITLQKLAMQCLGNILIDCPEHREFVLSFEVVEPLLQILSQGTLPKLSIWMLKNLCRLKSGVNFEKVSSSLPSLSNLLFHNEKKVLTDACWTIYYLANGHIKSIQGLKLIDQIQRVIDAGVCDRLVDLLMHSSEKVANAALHAVGNIVRGDDNQTQFILNLSILPKLMYLVSNPNQLFRKNCCWVVSNITAGNQTQIQEVIDAKFVPTLVYILRATGSGVRTKTEAVQALKNICDNGSAGQINFIVKCGCIQQFCNLLTTTEPEILTVVLDGLKNILRVGEEVAKINGEENRYATMIEEYSGYEKIISLKSHEDLEVCNRADYIIATYKFPTQNASMANDLV